MNANARVDGHLVYHSSSTTTKLWYSMCAAHRSRYGRQLYGGNIRGIGDTVHFRIHMYYRYENDYKIKCEELITSDTLPKGGGCLGRYDVKGTLSVVMA